jgi:phosphatidylinositol alpha-1,6-mannosyltransferase
VISGDLPAIRELVEHNVNGILVDGRDVAAVAASLQTLAVDQNRRRILGAAGRIRVVNEFSLAKNVDRLEKLLAGEVQGEKGLSSVAQPRMT